eukprot:6746892-Prymnesium_polylepis.1
MACSTQSDGGGSQSCGRCRCTDAAARCSTTARLDELRVAGSATRSHAAALRSRFVRNHDCEVNTGVVLVRNDEVSREMVAWWAAGGYAPKRPQARAGHVAPTKALCPQE